MIINHKLKNIINAICLLIILFSSLISILHYYHLVNLSKILHSAFTSSKYFNDALTFLSIKAFLLYLWILNVGILFLLWFFNRNNEEQVFLKELSSLLQSQEIPDKLISYMISDTLGNVCWSSRFFTQIFKIKNFPKKESFLTILKANDDVELNQDIIHSIVYNLKMKQSSYIDLTLKIGSQDSALRLSYTKLNSYYLWQVMLIKLDYSIYNPSFSVDVLNNLGLPVAVSNSKGFIIYKNDFFVDTFKINPLKEYFISDIVPQYKRENSKDRVLGNSYICKDVQDNDLSFILFETTLNKLQNNSLQYSRFVFIPTDSYSENALDNLSQTNINEGHNPSYGLYLEDIYNYAPFGIMVIDDKSDVIKSNLYIQQNFKIESSEIPQKIYNILGEKNLHLQSFLSSNENSIEMEIEVEVDANGEEKNKLFKLIAFPLVNNYRILYLIDITQNKYLQEQIKLSQGLQTIGQIASVVAHDFNNLLTAIMSFTYFLQERHSDDDPSSVELDQIKQNANRAKIMIKQLLTFSRKQELNPVVFEVNSEISDLMTTILRLMGEKITAQFNRGKNVGKILMDKVQFQQVITNLVVNARDAMKNGGKLEIFTSSIVLKNSIEGVLGTIIPGNYILIEVKDYGVGIVQKNLKIIFQSHFSTKGDKGNGLGLSTVQKIIYDNAGFIDIQSKLNEGTSIYLYLPKTDQEIPATIVDNQLPLDDLTGSETILLVEDELPVRMVCSRLLKSKGYNVIEASSGDNALSLIKEQKIKSLDLVISDVMMPGLSGPELIARLRDDFLDIKAILISGYTEDILDDINGDISLKGIDFLAKPFTPDVFASKVKSVLTNNKHNQKKDIKNG